MEGPSSCSYIDAISLHTPKPELPPTNTSTDSDEMYIDTPEKRRKAANKMPRKKKKVPNSDSKSRRRNTSETPKFIEEMVQSIDNVLEEKAAANNLSSKNVKSILHYVATNENVLEMVNNIMKGEPETNLSSFEPKLTRARTKALLEENKPLPWPITPSKKEIPKCTATLIEGDLPDTDSGEEYAPEKDIESDQESLQLSINEGDITASTPKSVSSHTLMGPPRTPGTPHEEGTIGRRTRSKLPMTDIDLMSIEEAYIPPDITADMYDPFPDCDEPYANFLREVWNPAASNMNETYDEDADPEFNVVAVEEECNLTEEELKEEQRIDKAVKVTKKELSELMVDQFEANVAEIEDPSSDEGEYKNEDVIKDTRTWKLQQNEETTTPYVRLESPQAEQLAEQMVCHVQQLLQSYLMSVSQEEFFPIRDDAQLYLTELYNLSSMRSNSYFSACNLPEAMRVMEAWEKRHGKSPHGHTHELTKKTRGVLHLSTSVVSVMAKSTAFVYPDLLSETAFWSEKSGRVRLTMTKAEERLLILGLHHFEEWVTEEIASGRENYLKALLQPEEDHYKKVVSIPRAKRLVAVALVKQFLMPMKTCKQLRNYIIRQKTPLAPNNVIKEYFRTKRLSFVEYSPRKFDANSLKPLFEKIDDPRLPRAWQHYLKNPKLHALRERIHYSRFEESGPEEEQRAFDMDVPTDYLSSATEEDTKILQPIRPRANKSAETPVPETKPKKSRKRCNCKSPGNNTVVVLQNVGGGCTVISSNDSGGPPSITVVPPSQPLALLPNGVRLGPPDTVLLNGSVDIPQPLYKDRGASFEDDTSTANQKSGRDADDTPCLDVGAPPGDAIPEELDDPLKMLDCGHSESQNQQEEENSPNVLTHSVGCSPISCSDEEERSISQDRDKSESKERETNVTVNGDSVNMSVPPSVTEALPQFITIAHCEEPKIMPEASIKAEVKTEPESCVQTILPSTILAPCTTIDASMPSFLGTLSSSGLQYTMVAMTPSPTVAKRDPKQPRTICPKDDKDTKPSKPFSPLRRRQVFKPRKKPILVKPPLKTLMPKLTLNLPPSLLPKPDPMPADTSAEVLLGLQGCTDDTLNSVAMSMPTFESFEEPQQVSSITDALENEACKDAQLVGEASLAELMKASSTIQGKYKPKPLKKTRQQKDREASLAVIQAEGQVDPLQDQRDNDKNSVLMGKCKVNPSTFKNPAYAEWARPDPKSDSSVLCILCRKSISLSLMGNNALQSHQKGKKHLQFVAARKNGKSSVTPLMTDYLEKPSTPNTTPVPAIEPSVESVPVEPQTSTSVAVATGEDVVKAELYHMLRHIAHHRSYRGSTESGDIYRLMFPDSKIAENFTCSKDKIKYMSTYGIAPYVERTLLSYVKGNTFVLLFDETMNRSIQKKQLDVHIRFWSDKELVSTRYLKSYFIGHSTAEDLKDKIRKACSQLRMEDILQLSMDGPNVNWAVYKDFTKELEEQTATKLLNVGSCGIHIVHNAIKSGHAVSSWKLDDFLINLHKFFKDAPARRQDFEEITELAMQFLEKAIPALEESSPESVGEFIGLLEEFNQDSNDPVILYNRMKKLLEDHPSLAEEFVIFLKPEQARKCGCYQQYINLTRTRNFIRCLTVHTQSHPGQMSKLIKALTALTKNDTNTVGDFKSVVLPFVKGNPYLTDLFLQMLPTERPPENFLTEFEEVSLTDDKEPDDLEFETVVPPNEPDTFGDGNCQCSCHHDSTDAKLVSRQKHCVECALKFVDGRIFIQTGKVMKPGRIVRKSSQESPNHVETAAPKRQRRDSANVTKNKKVKTETVKNTEPCDVKVTPMKDVIPPAESKFLTPETPGRGIEALLSERRNCLKVVTESEETFLNSSPVTRTKSPSSSRTKKSVVRALVPEQSTNSSAADQEYATALDSGRTPQKDLAESMVQDDPRNYLSSPVEDLPERPPTPTIVMGSEVLTDVDSASTGTTMSDTVQPSLSNSPDKSSTHPSDNETVVKTSSAHNESYSNFSDSQLSKGSLIPSSDGGLKGPSSILLGSGETLISSASSSPVKHFSFSQPAVSENVGLKSPVKYDSTWQSSVNLEAPSNSPVKRSSSTSQSPKKILSTLESSAELLSAKEPLDDSQNLLESRSVSQQSIDSKPHSKKESPSKSSRRTDASETFPERDSQSPAKEESIPKSLERICNENHSKDLNFEKISAIQSCAKRSYVASPAYPGLDSDLILDYEPDSEPEQAYSGPPRKDHQRETENKRKIWSVEEDEVIISVLQESEDDPEAVYLAKVQERLTNRSQEQIQQRLEVLLRLDNEDS